MDKKKVTLYSPTNGSIQVDEEHAERILNHPSNKLNPENAWSKEKPAKAKKDASNADTGGNKGTAKATQEPGTTGKGGEA